MLPYWFLFLLAVAGMLVFGGSKRTSEKLAWWTVCTIFVGFIGLRDEVGADWWNYLVHYRFLSKASFERALQFGDPGYYSLNWLVSHWGGDIYWLNSICAIMVMMGAGIFCRAQPQPWVALSVAVPYFLVVVAMGYTRQATALGWALAGLAYLGRQKNLVFVLFVLIGATFHKSAVLLLPIAALASARSRAWTWIWVGVTSLAGAQLLLMDESEQLWDVYVEQEMQSQGGQIRVVMNAVPAVLFLLLRRRLTSQIAERRLWWWLSVFSLACIPLVGIASTAVDRVALYFIPLQMFVFGRLHQAAKGQSSQRLVVGAVLAYYGVVLFVWLNFATHAEYWVPYWMVGYRFGS